MAKGLDKHRQRQGAVADLGRELARRSKSHCELCDNGGRQLTAVEVEPLPEYPDADHALFVCSDCHNGVSGKRLEHNYWRFLESRIWSDIPPVQVTAVRVCRHLRDQGIDWAGELLDTLYLSPEVEAWLDGTAA